VISINDAYALRVAATENGKDLFGVRCLAQELEQGQGVFVGPRIKNLEAAFDRARHAFWLVLQDSEAQALVMRDSATENPTVLGACVADALSVVHHGEICNFP
jgi:hypothetical protein